MKKLTNFKSYSQIDTILFYIEHLHLQTTLFNNHLKLTSSSPSSINTTKIKEQISEMTIITQNILKTEFHISDPLIFIQSIKQQLASYRGQISELVTYLSQNSLQKTPDENCNSTLQNTPVSIQVQKKK